MPTPAKTIFSLTAQEQNEVRERFNKLVTPSKKLDCWEWQGNREFSFKSISYKSHRVAYELAKGMIPVGKMVCHQCDNRLCCNPSHFYLGSNSENQMDANIKRGGGAKRRFDITAANTIRSLYATGSYTQLQLAHEFNTDQSHISRIVNKVFFK
jgi:hypothetical protein